ncbi:MAG TPA: squalene synthase HpnC [Casimicrobiaceae bacterium]|nr:squalene synthase HpnC [Casimicrobiaceae bacterium]
MSVAHYENFPVASALVPRSLRPAVVAIYRFARSADDLADEGDLPAAERLAALRRYERAIDAIGERMIPPDPPFPDLAGAIARHDLPLGPFRDLLSAFRQDVTITRYADYVALQDYCRRSANPVGRLLLHLYGAHTPANCAWSDAICSALQLVNFWQDVAADWQRGRVYLPGEDLLHYGVTEDDIGAGRCGAPWQALMDFEVTRARRLLESGRPLTRAVGWRLGLELSGVLAGGHRILDGIAAVRGDVFRHRPRIGGLGWLAVARDALLPRPRHLRAATST